MCKAQDVIDKYGVLPSQFTDWLAIVGDAVDNIPGVGELVNNRQPNYFRHIRAYSHFMIVLVKLNLIEYLKKWSMRKEQFELSHKLVSLVCDIPFDTAILNEPLSLEVFEAEECQSFYDSYSFILKKSKVTGSNWLDQQIDFIRCTTLDSLKRNGARMWFI